MKIKNLFQITPRDPYGVYQAGEVIFDQESINGTSGHFNDPFGRSVPAKDTLRHWRAVGFPLFLSCDDYLALAGDPTSDDWSGHYLRNLREGRTIASPYLVIDAPHDGTPQVMLEQGRTRVVAIRDYHQEQGKKAPPIPVFFVGLRPESRSYYGLSGFTLGQCGRGTIPLGQAAPHTFTIHNDAVPIRSKNPALHSLLD